MSISSIGLVPPGVAPYVVSVPNPGIANGDAKTPGAP